MLTKLFVNTKLALENYKNDEKGVTAIEYALIAAGIAVAIITAVNTLGTDVAGKFGEVSAELTKS